MTSTELRLAELLAAISLATDLGTGQPMGHALRTCVIATELAKALDRTTDEVRAVHHSTLLRFLGCTADAAETAAMTGGDERAFLAAMAPVVMGSGQEMLGRLLRSVGADQHGFTRIGLVANALADPGAGKRSMSTHCEVAAMLAVHAGLEASIVEALAHGHERWDGKGFPAGLSGEAIPISVRIFVVARDADLARLLGEDPFDWMRGRKGKAYDPAVVDAFERVGPQVLAALDGADEWEVALATEPAPVSTVKGNGLDAVLRAFADFVDLKSPWTRGHSRKVAALAERAARHAGMGEEHCTTLRRAALVHDLGRVGIENRIWDKSDKLTLPEHERVRLHTYYTERILDRCTALAELAELACAHHERADGSGYHRGLASESLSSSARILAAADVFVALTSERPHRPASDPQQAARLLEREARTRLDTGAVACVLAAAGTREAPHSAKWPAGLTDREVEVLKLIALGRANKEVARTLLISTKTVGRHIENLYRKIDVSSRAAAALFAVEHGLLD